MNENLDYNPEGLANIANAVVEQAAMDYMNSYLGLKINKTTSPEIELEKLEDWFHSENYEIFTSVDPDYLIKNLKLKCCDDALKALKGMLDPMLTSELRIAAYNGAKRTPEFRYKVPPLFYKHFEEAIRQTIKEIEDRKAKIEKGTD